jgi:DNA-directed RNA polymerase subunit M/transcription elongation factor TFIIS
MYYIKISEIDDDVEQTLTYYCRKCGHTDENLINSLENQCVSQTFKTQHASYKHMINKYTKLDPTLPRLHNMKCPRENSHEDAPSEDILYLRYDDANMKFVYICPTCDFVWKRSDTKNKTTPAQEYK